MIWIAHHGVQPQPRQHARAFPQVYPGELWFLVKYHPEIEGETMELKIGSPLPFAMLEDKEGGFLQIRWK